MTDAKAKKPWYKRWWAIALWIFLGITFLAAIFGEDPANTEQAQLSPASQPNAEALQNTQQATKQEAAAPQEPKAATPQPTAKPDYDLEMSIEDIVTQFEGLSELQQEEKAKEFKGKRIKSSIFASEINKASLSSQYVVLEKHEYPYSAYAYAKAFFPSNEKENLLKAAIGDIIIFSGKFVSYKESNSLTTITTVEFTDSRFIGIKQT